MVPTSGLTRSKGSVSQAGSRATVSSSVPTAAPVGDASEPSASGVEPSR